MVSVPTQNIVPPITVGKAPSPEQVNLGQMQSNLAGVLAPGMLGNDTVNPMTAILDQSGEAGIGYQNAIANSRMQETALQAQQQALGQAEQLWEQQQEQPGLLDFLALGAAGGSALAKSGLLNGLNYSSNQPINPLTAYYAQQQGLGNFGVSLGGTPQPDFSLE